VNQGIAFNDAFTADGAVRLFGAQVGGTLDCTAGTFRQPGGTAVLADSLSVGQMMYCNDGFSADGEVRLYDARIGASLDCTGAVFHNPTRTALNLQRAEVHTAIVMRPATFEGDLDATSCKVGDWSDEQRTWPARIHLRGLTYDSLSCEPAVCAPQRLDWLRRDPKGYQPQPYEQLAAAYQREGDHTAARRVLIAKQTHRRSRQSNRRQQWPSIAWSALLRWTIGYGYQPWRVAWPTSVLFLAGYFLFDADQRHGLITAHADASTSQFSATRYTADLLLPVVNLGERAGFTATGPAAWHAFTFTIAGWLLTLALVAAVTGVFKRD